MTWKKWTNNLASRKSRSYISGFFHVRGYVRSIVSSEKFCNLQHLWGRMYAAVTTTTQAKLYHTWNKIKYHFNVCRPQVVVISNVRKHKKQSCCILKLGGSFSVTEYRSGVYLLNILVSYLLNRWVQLYGQHSHLRLHHMWQQQLVRSAVLGLGAELLMISMTFAVFISCLFHLWQNFIGVHPPYSCIMRVLLPLNVLPSLRLGQK
jgi:hypothetical protein